MSYVESADARAALMAIIHHSRHYTSSKIEKNPIARKTKRSLMMKKSRRQRTKVDLPTQQATSRGRTVHDICPRNPTGRVIGISSRCARIIYSLEEAETIRWRRKGAEWTGWRGHEEIWIVTPMANPELSPIGSNSELSWSGSVSETRDEIMDADDMFDMYINVDECADSLDLW